MTAPRAEQGMNGAARGRRITFRGEITAGNLLSLTGMIIVALIFIFDIKAAALADISSTFALTRED